MSPIRDLAALYGVETRALKQAVKRNVSRFPSDFMFQLSQEEQHSGVVRNFRIAGAWFPKRAEWKRRLQSIKERCGLVNHNESHETMAVPSVPVVFFSACMLIAAGLLVRKRGGFPQIGPVFSFIGFCVYIAVLFALSFHHRSGMWSIHLDRFPQGAFFAAFAAGVVGL